MVDDRARTGGKGAKLSLFAPPLSAEAPLARLLAITHDILEAEQLVDGLDSIARGVRDLFAFRYVTIVAAEDAHAPLHRLVMLGWSPEATAERLGEAIDRDGIRAVLKPEFEVFDACYFLPAESELEWSQSIYQSHTPASEPRSAPDVWHERDSLVLVLRDREGGMVGYMSIDGPQSGAIPSREMLRSMQLFVNLVGLALASARAHAAEIERRRLLERNQAQLRFQATHDALTALPNRQFFAERLEETLAVAKSEPDRRFAVLFVDLDGFKSINDTRGHLIGDEVLIAVAERLRAAVEPADVVARLGGDEFAVILRDRVHSDEIRATVTAILKAVARPIDLHSGTTATSASIGVAPITPHYASFTEVLRDADTAMYQAKNAGRSQFAVFEVAMQPHPSRPARTPRKIEKL